MTLIYHAKNRTVKALNSDFNKPGGTPGILGFHNLKPALIYHEIEFLKTHSIETLVGLCKQVDSTIEAELDVEILSSYGVEVEYPDEVYYDIPKEVAAEAIELSKKVKGFVLKQLEGKI